jgi:hypothetical protein
MAEDTITFDRYFIENLETEAEDCYLYLMDIKSEMEALGHSVRDIVNLLDMVSTLSERSIT